MKRATLSVASLFNIFVSHSFLKQSITFSELMQCFIDVFGQGYRKWTVTSNF